MKVEAPLVQIISLGAGLDTTYWNLRDEARVFKYIEVDFASVFERKFAILAAHPELAVDGVRRVDGFTGEQYCFVACDLRQSEELSLKLAEVCDLSVPTLFLAECVFCYVDGADVTRLIQMTASFERCAMLSYDMINPSDAFGRMMIENISSRGIRLPGLLACPTLEAQVSRFRQVFPHVEALNMLEIYRTSVDVNERRRIEALEWLDELEEWELISTHYCMVLGSKEFTLGFR